MQEVKIGTSETNPYTITTLNDFIQIQSINQGKKLYVKLKLQTYFQEIIQKALNIMTTGQFRVYIDIQGLQLNKQMLTLLVDVFQSQQIEVYCFNATFTSLNDTDFCKIIETRGFFNVKQLILSFTRITSASFDKMQQFYNNQNIQPQLQNINFKGLSIGQFDSLKWMISNSIDLISLNLSVTDCPAKLILELMNSPKCENIIHLSLGFLQYYSDDVSQSQQNQIIQQIIVQICNFKHLQTLDLSGSNLDVLHYKYIIKVLSAQHQIFLLSLKALYLDCCNLKDDFIEYVCSTPHIFEQLEYFSLKSNSFSEMGLNIIVSTYPDLSNSNGIIIDMTLNNFNQNACSIISERFQNIKLLPTEFTKQQMQDYAYQNKYLQFPLTNNTIEISQFLQTPSQCMHVLNDENQHEYNSGVQTICQHLPKDNLQILNKLNIVTTQKHPDSLLTTALLSGNTISYNSETQVQQHFISDDLADKRNQIINPEVILSYQQNVQAINDHLFKSADLTMHKISLNSMLSGWKMIDDSEKSIFSHRNKPLQQITSQNSKIENHNIENDIQDKVNIQQSQQLSNSNDYALQSVNTGQRGIKYGNNESGSPQRQNNTHIQSNNYENAENNNQQESDNLKEEQIIELSELSYDYDMHGSQGFKGELQYDVETYTDHQLYEANVSDTQNDQSQSYNFSRLNAIQEFQAELSPIETVFVQNIQHEYKINKDQFKSKIDSYFWGFTKGSCPLSYVPDNTIFIDISQIEEQRRKQIHKSLMEVSSISVQLENLHIFKELNLYFQIEVRQDVMEEQSEQKLVQGSWDILFTPEMIYLVNPIKQKAVGIEISADFHLYGKLNGYMIVYVNDWETGCVYRMGIKQNDFKAFIEVISILVYSSYVKNYNNNTQIKYFNILQTLK